GGGKEALRIVRRRRADDLEPWDVREGALRILGVERAAREASTGGEADDDRDRRLRAEELLRGYGHQLVPSTRDEVRELHLGHRPEPHERRSGRPADDRRLGEGRVDPAPRPELRLDPERALERPAVDAHVLAEDEDARVAPH